MPASGRLDTDSNVLTDVLSARVPAGFSDQVREAARAAGVKPGTLIRLTLAERIERAGGIPTMSPKDRAAIVGFGGERLAQNIERAAVDDEYRAGIEREVAAARFRFMDRIIAAHGHLGAYIAGQSALDPGQPVEPAVASEALDRLRLAFAEMDAARSVERDIGRIVMGEEG